MFGIKYTFGRLNFEGKIVPGVISEPDTSSGGSMIMRNQQLIPLLTQEHAHICTSYSQVAARAVKAKILDLIALLQLDCLEVS